MSTTGAVVAAAVSLNGSLPILGPPPTYSEAVACPSPVIAQPLPTTSAAAATTTTSDSAAAAAAQRLQPSIWTVPLPLPDVSQMTPPPSYAESLAANALAASRLHTCSRQQHNPTSRTTPAVASSRHHQPHHHHHQNNQQQSAPNAGQCQQHSALAQRLSSPICARHLHRCPSNSRRNSNGSNGTTGTGGANHPNANNSNGHRATGRRTSLHLVFPADQTAAGNGTSNRNAAPAGDQESATNGTACADRFRDLFLTILMRVLLIFLFVVFMRILITQLSPEES